MCAKHYENPKMLSKVIAKNVGDVFLRHTVVCINVTTANDKRRCRVTKSSREMITLAVINIVVKYTI